MKHRNNNTSPPKTGEVTLTREELEGLILDQKMQALSRFAGKVAHDFNNVLTPILLNSQLLLRDLSKEDPSYVDIEDIVQAGARGEALTRQRWNLRINEEFKFRSQNLNAIIKGMRKSISSLISQKIHWVTNLDPSLGLVNSDLKLMEQLITNLVENACKAMPQGGKLTIETKNFLSNEGQPLMMLTIGDTGVGINPEIQHAIFEPLFTTEKDGQGLGLTLVYQIVKRQRGSLSFTSEPGRGTTIKIIFPVVQESKKSDFIPQGEKTHA